MFFDKYSSQFLSKGNVFLMDLVISIVVSVGVAVLAFLFDFFRFRQFGLGMIRKERRRA